MSLTIRYLLLILCCFFFKLEGLTAAPSPIELELNPDKWENDHYNVVLKIGIPQGWHVSAPSLPDKKTIGMDPSFSWGDSKNIVKVQASWPQGEEKTLSGQKSLIYQKDTFVPLTVFPHQISQPSLLNLRVSILACASICVPIEKTLTVALNPHTTTHLANESSSLALWELIGIALLGGFILNFMPCVLPVLSLKVLNLIKHSKKKTIPKLRKGFFLTALGILTSFLILAFFIIILKKSGESIGWGIHFQNPLFLSVILVILLFFSASLFGLFELSLPPSMGNWLITHEGQGMAKDFFSGVFATLLATPCSAPFVGTAIGFALTGDTFEILLIFFCIGLGFACPYLFAAILPSKWIRFPQPGYWMIRLQQTMGACLLLTALWIISILNHHMNIYFLLLMLSLITLSIGVFWLKQHKYPFLHEWLLALPLLIISILIPQLSPHHEDFSYSQEDKAESATLNFWHPFNPQAIPGLLSQGKIVFVDVTAQWCVTCAVNKQFVINHESIRNLLADKRVVAMQADWTKQDKIITQYLQSFERYGIPFNVVYGPNSLKGILLPELLTVKSVIEAFNKAGFYQHPSFTSSNPVH